MLIPMALTATTTLITAAAVVTTGLRSRLRERPEDADVILHEYGHGIQANINSSWAVAIPARWVKVRRPLGSPHILTARLTAKPIIQSGLQLGRSWLLLGWSYVESLPMQNTIAPRRTARILRLPKVA